MFYFELRNIISICYVVWSQKRTMSYFAKNKFGASVNKAAPTDMRYFGRKKLPRSLVHKKNFSLI